MPFLNKQENLFHQRKKHSSAFFFWLLLLKLIFFFGFVTVEHVIPNFPSKLVSPLSLTGEFLRIEKKETNRLLTSLHKY